MAEDVESARQLAMKTIKREYINYPAKIKMFELDLNEKPDEKQKVIFIGGSA